MSEQRAKQQQQHRKEDRKIHTYYDVKDGKLIRHLRKCPRCGSFMASHKGPQQRWACGSCGYTEFVAARQR